jgi:hypothetical protein
VSDFFPRYSPPTPKEPISFIQDPYKAVEMHRYKTPQSVAQPIELRAQPKPQPDLYSELRMMAGDEKKYANLGLEYVGLYLVFDQAFNIISES